MALDLQQKMDNQQENDEWLNTPISIDHRASLFNKIHIKYDNQTIENHLSQLFSKPVHYVEDPQRHLSDEQEEKEEPTPQNNQNQALYDPLQDDDNEVWMKKLRSGPAGLTANANQSKIKPLICPSCFTQIAFQYCKQYDQQRLLYRAISVFSIVVKQNLIIRNKNCTEKMAENVGNANAFLQRQQEFNVKIICECNCGAPMGYYDVNREDYVLSNVI